MKALGKKGRRPKAKGLQVVFFTRQLASMLGSGVSLMSALETLAAQAEGAFREILGDVAKMVASGIRLSVALNEYPESFPRISVVMVQIGEQTGALENMLSRVSDWLERDEGLRQRIIKALTYPAFVTVLAVVLTLGLFYTIVPGFLQIFEEMRVELPLITRVVKFLTDATRSPSMWLLTLALGSAGYYLARLRLTRPGAWIGPYRIMQGIPVVGKMLEFGAVARFAGTLGILLDSGMDMPKALHLSILASGQPLWEEDSKNMLKAIQEGEPLSAYLNSRPDLYPTTLTQMTMAGEEAARLGELCMRVGAYYELELGFQIDALSSIIEPILLAGVSLVVGSVVISLFLPLYGFIAKLGN